MPSCCACSSRCGKRSCLFDRDRERAAKDKGKKMAGSLEFWFRRKYNLAPNDPSFLDLTKEDIEAEYWAWYYHENGGKEEIEDEDFDVEAEISRMNEDDWEEVNFGRSKD